MPSNAINPNNYNIDKFDSGILGPITDTSFRDFLLGHNLQSLNPAISNALGTSVLDSKGEEYIVGAGSFNITDVPSLETVANQASEYNNFTKPTEDNINKNISTQEMAKWQPIEFMSIYYQNIPSQGTSYGVPQTFKLSSPGNIESWVSDGGYVTTTHEIRDIELLSRVNNKYGPANIVAYNDPDGTPINTGFIQYNDQIQGDFRDTFLNRTLGVGVIPFSQLTSGINYKPDGQNISDLDKIARKRRGDELKNRLRLNFTDNTVGAINTSPFGLLAGGNLIERNYTITVPKTKVGKAAEFLAKLSGFNLPTSIIPQGSFGGYGVDSNDVDITNDILDYTGGGQKSLLYDSLYINKYGPRLESANNPISNATVKKNLAGAGQPPTTENYLTYTSPPADTRKASLIEDINNKVKNALKGSEKTPQKPEPDYDGTDPVKTNEGYGFDTLLNKVTDTWDVKGPSPIGSGGEADRGGIGTAIPWEVLPDTNVPLDNGMYWGERTNPFKKGILKYTQDLVNNSINKKDSAGRYIGVINNDTNFDTTGKHKEYSNGNTTLTEEGDAYCRSWSVRRPYKSFNDLIRHEKNWWRIEKGVEDLLTITENGTPKIAWDSNDAKFLNNLDKSKGENIKGRLVPYMLSIENLAWKDAPQYNSLPACEKGPNGGRIMWFPPYNLDFSDNTSVSWDTTSFIGRGEPIYTYNHTERSGALSFSIVVDHPSVLNQMRKDFSSKFTDDFIHTFFGGCSGVKDFFKEYLPEQSEKTPKTEDKTGIIKNEPLSPKEPLPPPLQNVMIFFPNARNDNQCPSPNKGCTKVNTTQLGRAVPDLVNPSGYEVTYNPTDCITGLNRGVEDDLNTLAKFLVTSDGKNYTIKINGYCSGTASTDYNKKLGNDRALATRDYLLVKMQAFEDAQGGPPKYEGSEKTYLSEVEIQGSKDRWVLTSKGDSGAPPDTQDEDWVVEATINPCLANGKNENSLNSKQARNTTINLEYTPVFQANIIKEINNESEKASVEQKKEITQAKEVVNTVSKYFINECDYFLAMKNNQPFIYDSLKEKLDNFHPAFHAITPEGFNSRLTFLQQCTRQGPQLIDPNAPQNMVFGRPPVCVLKIGDFYHTKIIIDSVNFTYEPLQWDLNPEGIGVQPMLVKVDLSFKFIGGSSLGGPIKQLQNAVSYNFFANTGIYQKATPINNYLASKGDLQSQVIYGAFLTPEAANDAYSELQAQHNAIVAESTKSVNNNDTTNAGTSIEEKTKTEEGMPKDVTVTSTDNKPPTPPTSGGKSKGGTMVYNKDGSVITTDINSTFQKNSPNYQPPITIMNRTDSPIVVQNVNESSNIRGMAPILPNETATFNLVPELDPGITYSRSITVTTNRGVNQIKVFLKPE